MNPQEREVISGIFERLKQVESQPRDAEAERYIADLVARQPYAPYALAQAVFVQEQALKQHNERLQALEAELEQARQAPPASGGFLSGLFGGGAGNPPPRTSVPPTRPAQPFGAQPPQYAQPGQPAGPWGGAQQQPGAFGAGAGGGGFLRGALATAAGVAGGALLFEGLKGMFGGNEAHAATPGSTSESTSGDQGQASSFGDPAQLSTAGDHAQNDQGGHDPYGHDDYQDASYDDGGDYGDSGGDDGWI